MHIKPPFKNVNINTADDGFYEGYSIPIALVSKIVMSLLVLWALLFPLNAGAMLENFNNYLLQSFNVFYIVVVGFFACLLLIIALVPSWGRRRLGKEGEKPEFNTFSWFAMMFGAGLGVGLMVYATAEPVGLWSTNPVTISSGIAPQSPEGVASAFRYTFLHYGFHAWAIYVVTGLSLAYYAYTRDLPLTIRSAITPILGRYANGFIGHVVDILGIVATMLGIAVTIGFGVSQFVDGLYAISGMQWLMNMNGADLPPTPSTVGLISALIVIMGLSIISAVSGVGRGVKYLSNLNLVMSVILLLTFAVFGSFLFSMTTFGSSLADYLWNFIYLSFNAYGPLTQPEFVASLPAAVQSLPQADITAIYDSSSNAYSSFEAFKAGLPDSFLALQNADTLSASIYESSNDGRLFNWQSGWTTFYWAWWIAFSPFVGLFLARISKGRTVREFILGCVIAPSIVCFAWMTILGGTAIDIELAGQADPSIVDASTTSMLFVALENIISGGFLTGITIMCVVLIMTFLITSADSGILVMNTIMSGGSRETGVKHRIIWGVILTAVIGSLIIVGNNSTTANPLNALQDAMIIGALPFAVVMLVMGISLVKAMIYDNLRSWQKRQNKAQNQSTT